jgi:hypothetical protein
MVLWSEYGWEDLLLVIYYYFIFYFALTVLPRYNICTVTTYLYFSVILTKKTKRYDALPKEQLNIFALNLRHIYQTYTIHIKYFTYMCGHKCTGPRTVPMCNCHLCVGLMGYNQGAGSQRWVRGGMGPGLCKMRQLTCSMRPGWTGIICIHSSKATTPSKDFCIWKHLLRYYLPYNIALIPVLYIFIFYRLKINQVKELWWKCIYSWAC